jgi:predicted RNA-binding Zn ribbon-like protein
VDTATFSPIELQLSHLLLVGGRPCLDFCNTVEYRHSESPVEMLIGYRALIVWAHRAGLVSNTDATTLLTRIVDEEQVFLRALRLREAIYALIMAHLENRPVPTDALATLHGVWQTALDHRQVIYQNGQFSEAWAGALTPERILWMLALSAVHELTQETLRWVRPCPNCGWLFLDESRNHKRVWCNMQICGNRLKARRYYQRQKRSGGESL